MRSRHAVLLETLLAAGVLIATVTLVAIPLLGQGGLGVAGSVWQPFGQPLSVPAQFEAPPPEDGLNGTYERGEAVELSGPTLVTANVFDPSLPQRLGLLGGTVTGGVVTVAVLVLLLQIVRSLREEVFVPANARRLQLIALFLAVGGMAAQVLHQVGAAAVLEAERVRDRVTPVFELSFAPLVAALAVAVLGEVFRRGVQLREDVEGLV
jgi:hypothetical protein